MLPRRRTLLIAGTLLLAALTTLICLIPKPENDLFFELRIGGDILHTGHLPHVDTYSWTRRGTRWDVPEWLAFALNALAFRAGGFLGTWLLMVVLALAAVGVVWFWLAERAGPAGAFVLANLMLLALSDYLQERPYAYSYALLALSLTILMRARAGRPRLLLGLPPLCVLWTNLHQGVLSLIGLLLVYAVGDALSAARGKQGAGPDLLTLAGREQSTAAAAHRRRLAVRAWQMLGTALACTGAAMASPYGWRVFWNVFITLRDPNLMANVTEWNPATVLPISQMSPFLILVALTFGALALSPRRTLADGLALLALLGQAVSHARGIPLFAVGSLIIAGGHWVPAAERLRPYLPPGEHSGTRRRLLLTFTLLYAAAVTLVSLASLRRAIGPLGYSLEGIGQAVARVPDYPERACAFMEAERFPPHLRLLNDFETGGFLMWRLPHEPVFVDGRLDVYVGRTFDDMLTLARTPASPAGLALRRRYDFDCVLTANAREVRAFEADPLWQIVYTDSTRPHKPVYRVFLRRRPEFAALIARCLQDKNSPPVPTTIDGEGAGGAVLLFPSASHVPPIGREAVMAAVMDNRMAAMPGVMARAIMRDGRGRRFHGRRRHRGWGRLDRRRRGGSGRRGLSDHGVGLGHRGAEGSGLDVGRRQGRERSVQLVVSRFQLGQRRPGDGLRGVNVCRMHGA